MVGQLNSTVSVNQEGPPPTQIDAIVVPLPAESIPPEALSPNSVQVVPLKPCVLFQLEYPDGGGLGAGPHA